MKSTWVAVGLVGLTLWSVEAATGVLVSPSVLTLRPGAQQQFSASVTGSSSRRVFWTASCGTITVDGLYTAPSTGATCIVRARHWYTSTDGIATVTILLPPAPQPTPTPEPTPLAKTIWGVVNPATLGTCSADDHDRHLVDLGMPVLFRTWHPQVDPSGCVYAHEHGDSPARMTNAEIARESVVFGLIGYVHGHEEPHEGFKVFIAVPGDVNDEGRVNRVYSRSIFHMGTGGPARFSTRFHSADIRVIHPDFKLKAFTKLMMDTGEPHTVCTPRAQAPTRDVMNLASPCKLDSTYEIWGTLGDVKYQGQPVYRAFATPAVFDPITVFNPNNPSEVVYVWDTRVNAILNFPNTSRAHFRGCNRESYAQPGYWYNTWTGRTVFYTDALGNELSPDDPRALRQEISQSRSIGAPATSDGLLQFKRRVSYCAAGLGQKN